jgi:hypothetical protein
MAVFMMDLGANAYTKARGFANPIGNATVGRWLNPPWWPCAAVLVLALTACPSREGSIGRDGGPDGSSDRATPERADAPDGVDSHQDAAVDPSVDNTPEVALEAPSDRRVEDVICVPFCGSRVCGPD